MATDHDTPEFHYPVELVFAFSGKDILALLMAGDNHYDHLCRGVTRQGGIVWGLANELPVVSPPDTDPWRNQVLKCLASPDMVVKRVLRARDLDLLAKVAENVIGVHDPQTRDQVRDLGRRLRQGLHLMGQEYKRLNYPPETPA